MPEQEDNIRRNRVGVSNTIKQSDCSPSVGHCWDSYRIHVICKHPGNNLEVIMF